MLNKKQKYLEIANLVLRYSMIEEIKQDIFKINSDALVHQCNCFNNMGSGIAAFIRENFPEAYKADYETKMGDPAKLGTFSIARVNNPAFPGVKTIVNIYSQFDFNSVTRNTRYDALYDALTSLRDRIRVKAKGNLRTLAIPFRIGSNRGGGDWNVVRSIIASVFADEVDFKVIICIPDDEEPLCNQNSK